MAVPQQSGVSVGRLAIDDSYQAYSEGAFRYLLTIEQKRFDRSGQPFSLVLIDVKDDLGVSVQMPHEAAAGVFAAMSLGLRETDFTGWYRENEVAGAVLTACGLNTAEIIRARLTDLLSEHVPGTLMGRLQIRVLERPTQTQEVASNRSELCP